MSRMGPSKTGRRVRRQFSEEFKEGAVRLVLDEGKSVGAVARELDLTPSALSRVSSPTSSLALATRRWSYSITSKCSITNGAGTRPSARSVRPPSSDKR